MFGEYLVIDVPISLRAEVQLCCNRYCLAVPTYAVITPAYNEASHLPATLAAVAQAMGDVPQDGCVIVVDNNSTDATAAVARAQGATVVFESHNQISRARNVGARAAIELGCRDLVFIDADTHVPGGTLAQAVSLLDNKACVCGGALVAFDREVFWLARWTLAFWNFYSRLRREAAGCFLFCTSEAFTAAGGFSQRVYASEEIWFVRAIKRWAKQQGVAKEDRCIIIAPPDAPRVVTSARKADRPVRTALTMLMLMVFPAAVYFRGLCGFWYRKG